MLLLIAESNLTKKENFYYKLFPLNIPKPTTSETLQYLIYKVSQNFFNETLKVHP